MKALVAGLALALLVTPALADYYVAGDFNVAWDPANAGYQMTETFPGSEIYTLDLAGETPGRHEFKITDGTWGWTQPSANSWLVDDGDGNVTVTFDNNTYADGWSPTWGRLGVNEDPGAWTAVGDFVSELGGADWNNADPFGAMTPMGGGIYSLTAVLPAGHYMWKAVVTGSWDSISWDARSVNTANWEFDVDAVNNTAILQVNALAGTVRIDVVPEPASLLGLLILGLIRRR